MKKSFLKTTYSLFLASAILSTAAIIARADTPSTTTVATAAAPSTVETVPVTGSADLPPQAPPSATTLESYKLQPGDIITITVPNFTDPNLNSQETIPPDGKISLALIGEVTASGKTTAQLQEELAKRWNEDLVNPAVSVTLYQKHLDKITVYGYVVHPGDIEFHPPVRLTQAVGAAGGGLPNADMHRIVLTRSTGEREIVDLSRPDLTSGTDADVQLNVGDLVFVPENRAEVTVVGEVKEPGSYDYKDNMTVMDALTACGGVLDDTADLKAAMVTHDGKDMPVDMYSMLHQGDMTNNIKLSSGDRIVVPQMRNRIYVFGDVQHPGYYLYKPNDRMLDALQGVGGPNADADLDKINLIRIDPTKNVANFQRVDVGKFLKKGDMSTNLTVQPGDCLYVPSKTRGFHMEDAWVALTSLNLLNAGAQVFRSGIGN